MSYQIFTQLIRKDLIGFGREYFRKLFDTCILFFTNIVVFGYLMEGEGLSGSYASFFLIGVIASLGLIEIVGKVGVLIADLEGDKTISHTLIMPIKSAFVFGTIALFWALTAALLALPLFVLGKVLLYKQFDLSTISWGQAIPMFILINLFYGTFALWLTSMLKGIGGINSLWLRFIAPMWMFGAYFYSWHNIYDLYPTIAYISLINPMVYVMEGMHAAFLGQEGYLPFWNCFFALMGFIVLCLWHAIIRLKKRLDCI